MTYTDGVQFSIDKGCAKSDKIGIDSAAPRAFRTAIRIFIYMYNQILHIYRGKPI